MPNSKTDTLIYLIKAMSKAEKRHFKLYTKRLPGSKDALFVKIFDLLESTQLNNDKKIIKKLNLKNTTQFVNGKRHLYSQILKSLRLLYTQKHAQIGINQEIDYATILAHKHLYQDSYEYLDRIDIPANEFYTQNVLNITELKRRLASHHDLTALNYDTMIAQTRQQLEIDWAIDDFYNELKKDFALLGHTRNEREHTLRVERFQTKLQTLQLKLLSTLQRFNYYELEILFFKNIWDYRKIYRNAIKQFQLLNIIPYSKNEHHYIKLLIKCLSSILEICYVHKNISKYNYWYQQLNKGIDKYNRSKDKHGGAVIRNDLTFLIYFEILNNNYTNRINFSSENRHHESQWVELLRGQYLANQAKYKEAIETVNHVINQGSTSTVLLLNARLQQVLYHYRLNNFELVNNLLPGLRLAFKTSGHFNKSLNVVLTTLGKGVKALNFGLKDELSEAVDKLKVYSKTQYENIPFLYFDFINWFEAIKLDVSVSELNKQH